MQVGIDVKCMHTNFGGRGFPVSEILLLSKTAKFPFRTMGYIVHGSEKIESIGIGSKNSCK